MAVGDHLIRENVAKHVDKPRVTPFDAPLLTEDEIEALLDCVDGRRRLCPKRRCERGTWITEWHWREYVDPERLAPLLHLVLALGFRRGEFLKLLWADWDRKAMTLRVRDAKTPSGWRTLPLSHDL
jgi:integrase